ncbi:MAG TPA: sugar transferase [Polyangiaceae bacterium]|jgi:exopolysaccharide biosynthesis polyprenyl glycosylphosphotransferase
MSLSARTWQNINLLGDCLVLLLASVAATLFPGGIHWLVALGMGFGAMTVWVVGSRVLRHYDIGNGRGIAGDVALTLVLLFATVVPMFALRWFVPRYAEAANMFRFVTVFVLAVVWLRLLTSWLKTRPPEPPEEILVVGVGPLGRHTGLEIAAAKKNRRVTGYLQLAGEQSKKRLPAGILGTADALESVLKTHVVHEVYLAGDDEKHHAQIQEAIRVCERFGIPFALPANRFRIARAEPRDRAAMSDGYVHYVSYRHKPLQLALKRIFDIVASGAALVLLSPILIGVAVAIKLTSDGPIFFRQPRVGRYGRTFDMLKFRSMVVNAEELKAKLMAQNEQTGPVFKMKHDPRVTAIGRFIRKYSIDELPQFLNVLRGEMTIVGPRPPVPNEVAQYEAWQRRRLSVRPGITCVWQVSGRNEIGFEQWMYLDMQYIDNWSLSQDFQLIFKTVPVVLFGKGAS